MALLSSIFIMLAFSHNLVIYAAKTSSSTSALLRRAEASADKQEADGDRVNGAANAESASHPLFERAHWTQRNPRWSHSKKEWTFRKRKPTGAQLLANQAARVRQKRADGSDDDRANSKVVSLDLTTAKKGERNPWNSKPRSVVKNSKLCYPDFPDLEYQEGNIGDLCRSAEGQKLPWTCPAGCLRADVESIRCIDEETRHACRSACDLRTAPLFQKHVGGGDDPHIGDICMSEHGEGNEKSMNWMIPRGCELAGRNQKEFKYWFFGFHTVKGPDKILAPYTAELGEKTKACRIGVSETVSLSRNSPQCSQDPRFPHLESGKGQRGDVCRMEGFGMTEWACPKGCVAVVKNEHEEDKAYEEAGFCLERDGGGMCRKKKCVAEWKPLFTKLEDNSQNDGKGNRCMSTEVGHVAFMVPKGCKATKLVGGKLKSPLTKLVGKHHSGGPCRPTTPTHNQPVAKWKLVASSTHDINVGVSVGISKENGTEVETTESNDASIGTALTATLGYEVDAGIASASVEASVEVSAEYKLSEAISESVESIKGMSSEKRVEVSCPDGTRLKDREKIRNPLSVNTEYMYQWVVQSDKISVKTEHFRCHQTNGDEITPQCPPTLCGEPQENPYCQYKYNKCKGNKKPDASLKPAVTNKLLSSSVNTLDKVETSL